MPTISHSAKDLKQSGIRAASVRCAEIQGINLGQGICDMPTPELIKQAAVTAIATDKNIYSACEGVKKLRYALAEKFKTFNQFQVDPEQEIIVTHGATGAFVCAILSVFNPGDEVILFEPFYGYHKNILQLHNMKVKTVPMNSEDFSIDFDQLAGAIGANTKGIIVCTPCNPNGKIFSKDELIRIGELARQHDLTIITDEIYEYITYPGYEHISLASLEDFRDYTITISGFSKTYNMTGWRLGYAAAPAEVIAKMALVQDLLYVCPVTPLQYGVLAAFDLDDDYYSEMQRSYLVKRDQTVDMLRSMGFKVVAPQGAYYVMADFSALDFSDDLVAANTLLEKAEVATVPGRSFYFTPQDGRNMLRICYALDEKKVFRALEQIAKGFQ